MNRLWYSLVLLTIALLVVSMAILWRDNTASEDTSTLTSWAGAIFLCAVVCGPGLLAKALFAQLVPAQAHAKNRRRLLREIKRAQTASSAAAARITNIQLWHSWWTQEANRMRNRYMLAYREARKNDNPYANGRTG